MKNIAWSLVLLPLLVGDARGEDDSRSRRVVRCPADIRQEDYGQRRFRNDIRQVLHVNRQYTWLREQLLRRLPDGSLFCAFFTGGNYDGHPRNLVAAIRSDDVENGGFDGFYFSRSHDGLTWSVPKPVGDMGRQPHFFRLGNCLALTYRQ